MESVLVAILFTYIGIYLSRDFIIDFHWYMIPAAMLIVLFIRPFTGYVSLIGTELPEKKKLIISFYGIRGIGSVYYLLYSFYHANFEGAKEALALVMFVILLSVFVHGLSARTVMKRWVDCRFQRFSQANRHHCHGHYCRDDCTAAR